jgi:hypothetical protein
MIPLRGQVEFHESIEVFRSADRVRFEAGGRRLGYLTDRERDVLSWAAGGKTMKKRPTY